jgi:hypothetical protein
LDPPALGPLLDWPAGGRAPATRFHARRVRAFVRDSPVFIQAAWVPGTENGMVGHLVNVEARRNQEDVVGLLPILDAIANLLRSGSKKRTPAEVLALLQRAALRLYARHRQRDDPFTREALADDPELLTTGAYVKQLLREAKTGIFELKKWAAIHYPLLPDSEPDRGVG